jgi:hypothetical protein
MFSWLFATLSETYLAQRRVALKQKFREVCIAIDRRRQASSSNRLSVSAAASCVFPASGLARFAAELIV